jgi:hypothetical protein
MAIVHSIVLGKSKGSIGNVTFSTVKGQTVAKQKIANPTYSNTAGQSLSRGKMANAVLAWQYLAIFMAFINPLRKATESNYNAFIRLAKSLFAELKESSAAIAVSTLQGFSIGTSSFVTVNSAVNAVSSSIVQFNTGGLPFEAGTHVRVISFSSNTGVQKVSDRAVIEAEWTAQTLTVLLSAIDEDICGAYLYHTVNKKCSNIMFGEV